ncbi:MAG: hypothetical protein AABX66_01440 [Nanoarchaeota archaeon]
MSLDKFFMPLRSPLVCGSILFGSLGLSLLCTFGEVKLSEAYMDAGGENSANLNNYQKMKFIYEHRTHKNYEFER